MITLSLPSVFFSCFLICFAIFFSSKAGHLSYKRTEIKGFYVILARRWAVFNVVAGGLRVSKFLKCPCFWLPSWLWASLCTPVSWHCSGFSSVICSYCPGACWCGGKLLRGKHFLISWLNFSLLMVLYPRIFNKLENCYYFISFILFLNLFSFIEI